MLPRFIVALFLLLAMSPSARPASEPENVGADALVRPATLSEAKGSVVVPDFVYTAVKSYEPLAWLQSADRFASGATILIREDNKQHALVPTFAASADPTVSFDGKRILFSGKAHVNDSWQIWEIPVSGGAPRKITSRSEDCIRPLYLPDDRAVYARKLAGKFVIEVIDLAGGKPLALSYIPANALPADILHDGRILFEAGFPLGTDATPEFYTVYSDGSGVESYRCDHGSARYSGRQSSSGDIIFTSAQGLGRFTSARATELKISAPAGEFSGDFAETAAGDWLISWRPDNKALYRLMRWTQGSPSLQPLLEPSDTNELQPTLVAERTVPNRHPSGLHDWPNANLLCLNAYTSKDHFAPGSIHDVRVYTHGSDSQPKLLGTAPVERDGSFFVQVPTEQPLQIELLDSSGRTLKREAGFFWMRRGEQRACVGCHAGPETAPENAVPLTLLKSTTPADMTGASALKAAGGQQ